jgi:hypothetical protein
VVEFEGLGAQCAALGQDAGGEGAEDADDRDD